MKRQQDKYVLPEGWIWAKIEEIAILSSGGTPNRNNQEYFNGDIPWIKSGELNYNTITKSEETITQHGLENSSTKIFPAGTLLIALYGSTVGRLAFLGVNAAINQAISAMTTTISFNNKYLYYYLIANRGNLLHQRIGGAQPNISAKILGNFTIPIAPLNEQNRIVSEIEKLFSDLDNGISILIDTIQKLKMYRQVLLKSAFEGSLTEGWRDENIPENAQSLLINIQKQREEFYESRVKEWKNVLKEWEKSGKNGKRPKRPNKIKSYQPIKEKNIKGFFDKPQSWTYCRIGQIADLTSGYAFKSNDFLKYGFYRLIRMGNLYDNKLDMNRNPAFLSEDIPHEIIEKYSVNENDILISLTGTKGKRDYGFVVKIPKGEKNLLINQRILSFKSLISNDFLYYLLQSNHFRDQFFSLETGGGSQGNVSSLLVEEIVVQIPSLSEQEEIVKILHRQFTISSSLEHKILDFTIKIEILRQSILKMAFEGRLTPQNIEDEPAAQLLRQIQIEKKTFLAEQKTQTKQTHKKIKNMTEKLNIEEVLKISDKSMTAKDVWQQSKHKNNIEDFYKELKQIQEKVKVVTKGTESILTLVK